MNEPATLPQETSSFVVLSLFTCEPEQRTQFVNLADDFLFSQVRFQAGLRSVELFTDESGEHIVSLARWKDRASFEAFKQSESGHEVTSFGLALRPKVLFLRAEAVLPGESSPAERVA
ncbi:MAG TPA: antibiotic biosynthesis monooxygenase family protein [Terriglobales bacterium]|jgi:heme-degrading monooxygenase HmoA|nr:antibiotic biosynthesis monooxygenase family protein [Terriglobales bacterium]